MLEIADPRIAAIAIACNNHYVGGTGLDIPELEQLNDMLDKAEASGYFKPIDGKTLSGPYDAIVRSGFIP